MKWNGVSRGSVIAVFALMIPCVLASQSEAGFHFTPPTGLSPGDQYQLIFATVTVTTATNSDIGYYDGLVAAEALAAEGLGLPAGGTWHAVVSTPTVDARDHATSSGLPVYNSVGQLVAATSIYNGSLLAPVLYTSYGAPLGTPVWTGSDPAGIALAGASLGDPGGRSVVGLSSSATSLWMTDFTDVSQAANEWGLYALSDPITYVPEPSTFALVASGLAVLAASRRWSPSRRRGS